jgi:hypothetical protein
MGTSKHITFFNRDGISQQQRPLDEIDPLYAKIDDRQSKELLSFLWQIGKHIQYYDLSNSKSGNWQNFIGVEKAVLLALVATYDTSPLNNDFLDLHNEIEETIEGNAYLPIFDLLRRHALQLQDLYNKTNRVLGRELFLSQQNTRHLESFISVLAGLYRGYTRLQDDPVEDDYTTKLALFCEGLGIDYSPATATDFSGLSDHLLDDKIRVDFYALHQSLQKLFATIIGHTDQLFATALAQTGNHEPHIGLILTFLQLFKTYQDQFNNLTAKHLHFYFQDVLNIDYRNKVADKVNVIIQLAKKAEICNLPLGTAFKAGKDSEGNQLIYRATDNFVANKAQIAELKTLYHAADNLTEEGETQKIGNTGINFKSIWAAKKADSLDGKEEPLDEKNPKFPPFGTTDIDYGDTGFAFASPVLRLAGGERSITILLTLEKKAGTNSALASFPADQEILDSLFDVYLTCEKGWEMIKKTPQENSGINDDIIVIEKETASHLKITLNLGIDFPGIADFNKKAHNASFPEQWPVIKFLLKQNQSVTYYELCRSFTLTGYTIHTDVKKLKNLTLQNDFGLQKPAKPIMLFGSQPVSNAKFYIGSQEVFSKKLDSLTLKWDWVEYKTFTQRQSWYTDSGYTGFPPSTNADVKVVFERLVDNDWVPLFDSESQDEFSFFNSNGAIVDQATFDLNNDPDSNKFKSIQDFKKYDLDQQDGFIRIRLQNNDFLFGHHLYQQALLAPVISTFDGQTMTTTPTKVNRPRTPVIENIQLSYTASITHGDGPTLQSFYHLHPFGHSPLKLEEEEGKLNLDLVPDYQEEAALYIGIKDLKPAQNISMLFQFVEGTGDVNTDMPDRIEWFYLTKTGWQAFDERGVIKDSTRGFSGTGIITLAISKDAVDTNPLMPNSLFWVKASVTQKSRAVNWLASIKSQAMELGFVDQDNALDHYDAALPAEKISKLLSSVSQVKAVTQPFASFGNRPEEKQADYNVRVSERLRHKDRAVTLWDYERLVLENYPQIHKVKCLNHMSEQSDIHPGHVKVIVIPNLENLNAVNILQPAVSISLRREIKEFLQKRCSKLVRLEVTNPRYEKLQIRADVIFRQGLEIGYHNALLSDEIKDFLTPWKNNHEEIHFYEKLHSSVILNFIEERNYVDYLTSFVVAKTIDNQVPTKVVLGDITRSRGDALFVSVEDHLINTTQDD